MKVALSTGGGDCPGLNAAIRACVKHGILTYDMKIFGIKESLNGLLKDPPEAVPLGLESVTDILTKGGTILGTQNKGNPFEGEVGQKRLEKTINGFKRLGLDAIVIIGGEGSQGIASIMHQKGIPVIGIPKTIDNDLPGTEMTIGFSSCVDLVADSVTRLQSTAESHDRVMILEVMGRDSGYIALHGGLAGGAHVVLIPEIPFDLEAVCKKISFRQSMGRKYSVVVVSEGAVEAGVDHANFAQNGSGNTLGGIGQLISTKIAQKTGIETRVTTLGHLQRGGSPSTTDRILATRFGVAAMDLIAKKQFGRIVSFQKGEITSMPYESVEQWQRRKLPLDDSTLLAAEGIGICMGR